MTDASINRLVAALVTANRHRGHWVGPYIIKHTMRTLRELEFPEVQLAAALRAINTEFTQ
jgi:hypothetical protein